MVRVFALLGWLVLVLSACGGGEKQITGAAPVLVRPPARVLAACRGSRLLRPACPTLLPVAALPGMKPWRCVSGFLVYGGRYFDLGVGGEHLGHPELDQPPRFLHLVIAAGPGLSLLPLAGHVAVSVVRDGLLGRRRVGALFFGRRVWAGRVGELVLAPPRASGWLAIVSDHLIFAWKSRGTRYAITLHAWEPLTAAVKTLNAIVDSLPTA